MTKNLMIVESPAKAKTIEKYLGDDFTVKSCYGHIRDLPRGDLAIDVDNNFAPNYVVSDDKKDVVKELKSLAKKSDDVWLATDEDREGEAISWHLCEVLGLDPEETKRIVFHEITKPAIQQAVKHPRSINQSLVDAQQARRVLDRLVGFEVSPILWRKITRSGSLSAGRVQSVAVRLIVEREREIREFDATSGFRVVALFAVPDGNGNEVQLKAELPKRFDTEADALSFLEKCQGSAYSIDDIQVKPGKKTPPAPFTTSTLQQDAGRKLGFSVARTMRVAQRLYEAGLITYMRTDSTNLSDTAREGIAKTIAGNYGDNYLQPRHYKTKDDMAQEAHECIRPTDFSVREAGDDHDQEKLYRLIWNRTMASQMSDAALERTTASIAISGAGEQLTAKGEVLKFDGFLKVYMESADEETNEAAGMLPPLQIGQQLIFAEMTATERFSRPPARYTEAALVKKMEELGIGRPSTYAPTISTIQNRKYVVKEERPGTERNYRLLLLNAGNEIKASTETEIYGAEKNKLFPTDVGMVVNDFLVKYFDKVFDYGFTADIEKQFDNIAKGQTKWNDMIGGFYSEFHPTVEDTMENADRETGKRELGTDPKSGKPVIARLGRFGPMVQIGSVEDEEKPRFATIRQPQTLETITFEQALELFKLPRTLGEFEGKEVKANEGRFGPYVQHNGKFCSLKKEQSPLTVSLEEAIELIKEKREADAKKTIKAFEEQDIYILNGRWGPYIKAGKKNVKIPKDTDPETLTLADCEELVANAPEKKRRAGGRKKKA